MIGLNLVRMLTDAPVVGPVMLGLDRPAHLPQPHSCGGSEVVHPTATACANRGSASSTVDI